MEKKLGSHFDDVFQVTQFDDVTKMTLYLIILKFY